MRLPSAWRRGALASATSPDGTIVAGTRDDLYVGARRIPWEQVEKADWDADEGLLTVSEVGTWGAPREVHRVKLDDPRRLLQLIRERVTASILLQRHVPVRGRRGLTVVARRAPRGDQPVQWVYEFDEGVDPDDPDVRRLAAEALERARNDVGLP